MNNLTLGHCRNIIWDWNGTLLNDLGVCVDSINLLLGRRKIPVLDIDRYLEIFTFPVKDYYVKAGFDFSGEAFETVAVEFMDHYLEQVRKAGLHTGVKNALNWFRDSGREQIILSAMEHNELVKLVNENGIGEYFRHIFGIEDHLAHGKLTLASSAIKKTGFKKEETCLIGDTLHDAEVAAGLGINCLLIANGHQSEIRLKTSGYPVILSLNEIRKVF
ncbi:MAG: HAD family hydrolase [Lentimicrobium sp.]